MTDAMHFDTKAERPGRGARWGGVIGMFGGAIFTLIAPYLTQHGVEPDALRPFLLGFEPTFHELFDLITPFVVGAAYAVVGAAVGRIFDAFHA